MFMVHGIVVLAIDDAVNVLVGVTGICADARHVEFVGGGDSFHVLHKSFPLASYERDFHFLFLNFSINLTVFQHMDGMRYYSNSFSHY